MCSQHTDPCIFILNHILILKHVLDPQGCIHIYIFSSRSTAIPDAKKSRPNYHIEIDQSNVLKLHLAHVLWTSMKYSDIQTNFC